jgi:3-dehydroquinate synthase
MAGRDRLARPAVAQHHMPEPRTGAEPAHPIDIPVHVHGGSYLVHVARGALAGIARHVQATAAHSCAVIADSNVAAHYGSSVLQSLRAAGITATLLTFPAGERSKTRETWARLTDELTAAGYGRDSCVIALGGGVTGDLAGFVAATYLRGVPLVQVPTTLLAMVDAAIGGKTGVDTGMGKNLVGAFHHPASVMIDPAVLGTLPAEVLEEGFAEVVKHAAISDAQHFAWVDRNAAALRAGEPATLDALLPVTIAIKARVVTSDPLEHGARAALNFGHTIAHAIERLTDYRLPHGRAVAMGMVAEARIGEVAGVTEPGTATRLAETLARLGLPHQLPDLPPDRIVAATGGDKKSRGRVVRYTLLARIGACARSDGGGWTHAVESAAIAAAIGEQTPP